jgi:hypothetical protein
MDREAPVGGGGSVIISEVALPRNQRKEGLQWLQRSEYRI